MQDLKEETDGTNADSALQHWPHYLDKVGACSAHCGRPQAQPPCAQSTSTSSISLGGFAHRTRDGQTRFYAETYEFARWDRSVVNNDSDVVRAGYYSMQLVVTDEYFALGIRRDPEAESRLAAGTDDTTDDSRAPSQKSTWR